jgi:hypothetical protein
MENDEEKLLAAAENLTPWPNAPAPPEHPPTAPVSPERAAPSSYLSDEEEEQLLAAFHARRGDFERESLRQESPLVALLARVNSGLFKIAMKLEPAVLAALEEGSDPAEDPSLRDDVMNPYLRVTSQIERFTKTQLRAAAKRECKITDPWSERRPSEPPPADPPPNKPR